MLPAYMQTQVTAISFCEWDVCKGTDQDSSLKEEIHLLHIVVHRIPKVYTSYITLLNIKKFYILNQSKKNKYFSQYIDFLNTPNR